MENKLQELTQKLYNEGVEKAKQEAERILAEAKAEAEKLKHNAQDEALKIVADAENKSAELKKSVEAELALAAKQSIRSLKQEITELIVSKAIDQPVKNSFNDDAFVKEMIETLIKNWDAKSSEEIKLSVLLPAEKEEAFQNFFTDKTQKQLRTGLEVSYSDAIKGGFKIGPADGSYKISFSEEDFENFFKAYLRPKTVDLLFQGE